MCPHVHVADAPTPTATPSLTPSETISPAQTLAPNPLGTTTSQPPTRGPSTDANPQTDNIDVLEPPTLTEITPSTKVIVGVVASLLAMVLVMAVLVVVLVLVVMRRRFKVQKSAASLDTKGTVDCSFLSV